MKQSDPLDRPSSVSNPLIVGVGASVDGLQAFQEFLITLGETPGMAIVVVPHGDGASASRFAERLPEITKLDVVEIIGRHRVEADTIYLGSPQQRIELVHGFVTVVAREHEGPQAAAIDHFFNSIAKQPDVCGVGVIFSAGGSDRNLGLKTLRDRGGLPFPQDPRSDQFDNLSPSVATTGVPRPLMSPQALGTELLQYATQQRNQANAPGWKHFHVQIEEAIPTMVNPIDEFAPATAVIDSSGQVITSSPNIGKYLTIDGGTFQTNIIKMAPRDLRSGLRAAIANATQQNRTVHHEPLSLCDGEKPGRVMLTVQPIPRLGEDVPLLLVVFHELGFPQGREPFKPSGASATEDKDAIIAHLQRELETTREALDRSIQDLEAANGNRERLKQEVRTSIDATACAKNELENWFGSEQSATVFLNHDLLILGFTPAICEIYGLVRSDVGRPLLNFVPRVNEMPPLPDPKSLAEGDCIEHPVTATSGKSFIRRVLPYKSPHGPDEGIVVTFTDVSEQRESQKQLVTPVTQPRSIAQATPSRVAYVTPNLRYGFVNAAYAAQWQQGIEDVVGKKILEVVGPEHYQNIEPHLTQGLHGKHTTCEMTLHVPDSTETQIMEVTYVPQANPDGTIVGCHMVLTDITERKRSEQALLRSRQELAVGVDVAKLGLGRVDFINNRITLTAEAAAMHGISDSEITITRDAFHAHYHPEDRESVIQLVQDCLDGNGDGRCDLEYRIVLANGQTHWISTRKQVEFDRSVDPPRPTTAILAAQDITERKHAELNMAFLADLQAQFSSLASVAELMAVATEQTAKYLGLSRCILAEFDEQAQQVDIIYEHHDASLQSIVGRHRVEDFHTEVERKQLIAGRQFYLADTQHRRNDSQLAKQFRSLQIGAFCNSAYVTKQRIRFVVSATKPHAYQWRADELHLLQEIVNRLCVRIERARAETALADRETHLRRVIDNTVAFIGVLDIDGTLREANQPALSVASLRRDDVIGKPFWECYWWNYDDDVVAQLKSAFARTLQGETIRYDAVIRVGEDQRTTIDFMLVPVRDNNGKITHVIPSGVDVNDRKAAEDLVRQNAEQLADKQAKLIALLADYERAESKLQVLFDNGYYYTGIVELDGTSTDINEIALNQLGATIEQATNRPFWDCPWWGDNAMVKEKLKHGLAKAIAGEIYREDLPFWLSDGCERITDFIFTPARNQEGEVVFVVANGSDVTELRRAEDELKKREQHLKLSLQAGRLGTWEWNPESDRVTWSDELRSIFGRNDAPTDDSFAATMLVIHPEDRVEAANYLKAVIEGTGSTYRIDWRIIRADNGKTSWVENLGLISRNSMGKAILVTGITRDVTERKHYELALAEGKERLTMALRAGGMAVWEWSEEGAFWDESMCELLGLPAETQCDAQTLMALVHPDDLPRLTEAWFRTVEEKDCLDEEFRILRPDGSTRWIAAVGELVHRDAGEVKRVLGLTWDITEQHELQESLQVARAQAEAASNSKSEFLANMSHEIRTPMTAILGYTDLIAEQIAHPEALEHVRTIRRNGDFLLDIINDILDLSKIEAGKLEVSSEPFAPCRLIEDVRSIMEVRATEDGLDLAVEYVGGIPAQVVSDPKRLKQILVNLVGNAIKFTHHGGVRLRVHYLADQQAMRIDIIDTGIGMKPEQQTRLFKPFMQGDSSVTRDFGGTGLGLAISQRLAKMLGGNITAHSIEGKGSTFSVTIATGDIRGIALNQPSLTVPPPSEDHEQTAPITLDCNILVVDDRRDIRFLSKSLLRKAGATVDEAEDGEVAIEMVEAKIGQGKCYDLILLDMQMPRLDGYQTAEQLRRLGFAGPIIALTADAMQGDMPRCIQSGCNDYLSKPINKIVMLQLVRRYVDRSSPP